MFPLLFRIRTKGVLLASVPLLVLFAFLVRPSSAFASGLRLTRPHQAGTFIHLATEAHPLAIDPPTCSGSGCNDQNPYATYCAGQSWDSWWVVTSNLVYDNTTHQALGYLQLWWSQTCQTNWGRIVPNVAINWVHIWTGLSNGVTTSLDNSGEISGQLYAPVLLACTQGSFQAQNGDLATGASGQFRANWGNCY